MSNAIFFNPPLEAHWLGHQFVEIYKDKLYEPFLRGKKDLTIIDVGGNLGLTSYYFAQFAKDIYTLEPDAECYGLMTQQFEYNKLTQVHPINKALYTENGEFELWNNESNKTMSSLNRAIHDGKSEPQLVPTITLDKLFEDNNIHHVDLMKLDCEGAEYEILGHESFSKVADKIDVIIGEIHSWANRNPNQLKESLTNRGFRFEWLPKKDPNDAQLFVAQK
jgi:FkbM family methyltransferase